MKVRGDVQAQRQTEDLAVWQSLDRELGPVALQKVQVLPEDFAQRPVCSPGSIREAAARSARRLRRLLSQPLPELPHQPGLADSCIAEDGDKPGAALLNGCTVGRPEALKL